MPHAITVKMSFDQIEDTILFTRAALRADPDAEELVAKTDSWLSLVEPARAKDRACREAVQNGNASRAVANVRLDRACASFGDDLYLAVGKDRHASRWGQFFSTNVTKFTRQALAKQVATVLGWLGGSKDPVLDAHRGELEKWSKAAGDAVVQTRGTALARGEAHQAREELATELTRERDGLHEALAARARERGLPRGWPDLFFKVETPARRAAAIGDDAEAGGDEEAAPAT